MALRYLIAIPLALAVTFGLFYLMQALIAMEGEARDPARGTVIDFVRLKKDTDLELKKRKLPDKKPPEEPPPPPDLDLSKAAKPELAGMGLAVDVSVDLELAGGPGMGAVSDRFAIPLVRIDPQYPERAAQRGIEGYVIVEFTITAAGGVRDPVVLEAEPSSIFNRSSVRAVRRFKFQPKLEDGNPVEQAGMLYKFTYQLEADR